MTNPGDSVGWYRTARTLWTTVRAHWFSVAVLAFTGAVAAAVIAFLLPSYYSASAAFQAEPTAASPLSGSLAGLAAQFGGVQLPGQSNPQLFADILTTEAVLRRIAGASFPWKDGRATLAAIYGYDQKPPGRREYYTVRKLRRALGVDVNVRTGVVRFSVEAKSPALAVALADTALAALNEANIALRRARAAAEQSFTAERAEHARMELSDAESNLAGFYERNRAIANSPSLQIQEGRLRRTVDMAQQVYVQLRLQEEQAAVQAVRTTPAISVIDPPIEPVKPSWPRKKLAIAAGFACGLLLGLARLSLLP